MLAKIESKRVAIVPMPKLLTKLLKKAPKQANSGFTLIELLVAMIIATLVITPLLGFMVNILNSDRIEQAKATSEAEIQSAIDYIAQDLEQAIYIYNADGLENASTDTTRGIKNQLPPVVTPNSTICGDAAKCFPVLAFWKREPVKDILPVSGSSGRDDTFVYSLVAYYLIKGNTESGNWSDTARIGRFQIKDGVIDPKDPTNPGTPPTPKYVTTNPPTPSEGYQGFDLTLPGSTLGDKMNRWTKTDVDYNNTVSTLIDYVDKDTTAPIQNCPMSTQRVPRNVTITGFYTCVDSTNTIAQVYIRGNALARTSNTNSYSVGNSAYFPTASIQVKGRGFLGVN
jgi:prepilin-type N-terminal cleavage/methylation domain-containing protein